MTRQLWEGVYDTFQDVPESGPGFEGDRWIQSSIASTTRLLEQRHDESGRPASVNRDCLLPVVTALASRDGDVSVLDFGGGTGNTYLAVTKALPASTSLRYDIVEGRAVCEAGRSLFRHDPRVRFHTELPDIGHVDVLHLGSSLHYVDSWEQLLNQLADHKPELLLITDLPAGNFPSYVTTQLYYESRIPVRFFRQADVVAHIASLGFDLIFQSSYVATICGEEQELPQSDFPPHLRVGHTRNLLFRKTSEQHDIRAFKPEASDAPIAIPDRSL